MDNKGSVRTFENFATRRGTERALDVMKKFPDTGNPNSASMVTLCGRNGTGKTHLMEALGHRLLGEDIAVRYAFVPDLLDALRGTYADDSEDTAQAIFDSYQAAEVLLLDDVTEERVTEYAREQITRLVDGRYRAGNPLVVSTNLTLEQMGRTDLWGPRLADRLFDGRNPRVEVVELDCDSYRTGTKWPVLRRM